ncbi:MAG: hypothetical protein HZR80_18760 [Candidatus Heimdallarchaeota archaeon]
MNSTEEKTIIKPIKAKMVEQNYYYESPFFIVDEPRQMESYIGLIETELVKNGFDVYSKEKIVSKNQEDRYVPFNGLIKAQVMIVSEEKYKEEPNFLLLLLGTITILYCLISFAFSPKMIVLLPVIFLFFIFSIISLILYMKVLLEKGRIDNKIYHGLAILWTETILHFIGIFYSLIVVVILFISSPVKYALSIPLQIIQLIAIGLVIARCFFEFRIKRKTTDVKEFPIRIFIDYQGIQYYKLFEQQQNMKLRELEQMEFKFAYSVNFEDDIPEIAQTIIEEIREIIFKALSYRPVRFKKMDVTERPLEGPLKKDVDSREFPLSNHKASEKNFNFD